MATLSRLLQPVVVFVVVFSVRAFGASEALRMFAVDAGSLAVDSRTGMLYAGQGNRLAQIDPGTGEVLRSFDMTAPVARLERGAGNALWVLHDFAIRRFDLEALAVDQTIEYPGVLSDFAASPSDPFLGVVSTPTINGRWATAWIVRNGTLLRDSALLESVGMMGAFVYGGVPRGGQHRLAFGQNGFIDGTSAGLPLSYPGRFQTLGTYVYHSSGVAFDGLSLQPVSLPVYWLPRLMAIDRESSQIIFLTALNGGLELDRHEAVTLEHTGHYRFSAPLVPLADTLVAWKSNRVGFATATNLVVLDTAQLFAPADVEVRQTISPTVVQFGEQVTFTIMVTNRGAGAAINLQLTNSLGTGANLGTFEPGASYQTTITVLAAEAGAIISNRASVTLSFDSNEANNSASGSVQVQPRAGRMTKLAVPASDLLYHSAAGKLFRISGHVIQEIDAENQRLGTEIFLPPHYPGIRMEAGSSPNILYVQGPPQLKSIARIFLSGGSDAFLGNAGTSIIDYAPSPVDATLMAVSDDTGTYLARPGNNKLPERVPYLGEVEFSSDGSTVYFLNATTCHLEVYRAEESGLVLQQTRTNVDCSGITAANGLLYFSSGLVYDPMTGEQTAQSLKLPAPSFVLPRPNGAIEALSRTNGLWVLQRFSNSSPLLTIPLPELTSVPGEIVPAGPNRVAIRGGTTGGDVLLVDVVDDGSVHFAITGGNSAPLALQFLSVAGKTYRIEQSSSVDPAGWSIRRDNISGTGEWITEPLGTLAGAAFFRVATLP